MSTPDAAAVIWIDTDGKFHSSSHEYFESAEEKAEMIGESGLPTTVIYREDFIREASGYNE